MNGTLNNGLWKYGIMLGLFGLVIPVVFFAIGSPKIDSGTAMIAGAAELASSDNGRYAYFRRPDYYIQHLALF